MSEDKTLTLYELNSLVRLTIEQTLSQDYWVEAELSECRESRGHCYMELIQKDPASNTPVARAAAKCWRTTWAMLQPYFERTTGQQLHSGMKVRLKVHAQFHEAFGFSWIVSDIDPNYTLGDMARRRQEIIRQLRAEGVFDMQKELSLPLFCLNIAVISSATAAGYGDFAAQLNDSPFAFHTQLFPAVMQGEQVEQSIIAALNDIYNATLNHFDCVVIIRGGGATADLSGFDTLALAENVAQFPLPIITGIGHDRDESVLDMVSFLRVKTPTAAAQHLISHAQQVMDRISFCEDHLTGYAVNRLEREHLRLDNLASRIPTLFSLVRSRHEARLEQLNQQLLGMILRRLDREQQLLSTYNLRLSPLLAQRILNEQHRLELLQQRAQALDPALLLKRGYSMTLHDGRLLRHADEAPPGTIIETRLATGTLHSQVIPDSTAP